MKYGRVLPPPLLQSERGFQANWALDSWASGPIVRGSTGCPEKVDSWAPSPIYLEPVIVIMSNEYADPLPSLGGLDASLTISFAINIVNPLLQARLEIHTRLRALNWTRYSLLTSLVRCCAVKE